MAVSLLNSTGGTLILVLCGLAFVYQGFALSDAKVNPFVDAQLPLWRHEEAEVIIYRIPVLTYTPGGRLLAACEARKYSGEDAGPKFMAIRRSEDALGDKWEAMQYILDDGYVIFDGLNLGNVLVDDEKGIIFIMYSVCYHLDKCNASITKLVKSMDDGITWSKPVDLSDQVGTPLFAPGPGFAIQKKLAPNKGRLISCGHGAGVHCLLSDDHGMTWRWGASLMDDGNFRPAECQVAELPDGSLMLNSRNTDRYKCHCRIVARSYDGGETFPMKDVHVDEALVEPECAAGLLYHRDVLFFSNPKNSIARIDLTLQWSYDNGTTWASELQIWDKASGYSAMTAHPGSSQYIFILFEKGIVSYTESLEFVRVSLYDGV